MKCCGHAALSFGKLVALVGLGEVAAAGCQRVELDAEIGLGYQIDPLVLAVAGVALGYQTNRLGFNSFLFKIIIILQNNELV